MKKGLLLPFLFPLLLFSCSSEADEPTTYCLKSQRFLRREFLVYNVTLRKDGSATVVTQLSTEDHASSFEMTYTIKTVEGMIPGKMITTLVFGTEAELPCGNSWDGTWDYQEGSYLSFQSTGLAYDATRWTCADESGSEYETSESVEGGTCTPYCFGYESLYLIASK